MELAKQALDVGLYTNNLDAMLAFWHEQAHLQYTEMLPVGGGVRQHRHAIGESVLKVNHSRDPLPDSPPSGLANLRIYDTVIDEPIELYDPDGNEVQLLPAEENRNLDLILNANDVARSSEFYGDTLGLEEVSPACFAVGASRIQLVSGEVGDFERAAPGYRYMTFQVFDVVGTHEHVLTHGGAEGMAPLRLGDVAYISFVRDPDGNWIEISQRKSITGSLDSP